MNLKIDRHKTGFTASARDRKRSTALNLTPDMEPKVYDLVAQAEVEGRHAVDALMRVAIALRYGGQHA